MTILKPSDGQEWVMKDLASLAGWQKNDYGTDQLECKVTCLRPDEHNDGQTHTVFLSRASFAALDKAEITGADTFTLQMLDNNGKKSWKCQKGNHAAPVVPTGEFVNTSMDAVLRDAYTLYYKAMEMTTDADGNESITATNVALIAAMMSVFQSYSSANFNGGKATQQPAKDANIRF